MENLTQIEIPARETAVVRLLFWGNYCLFAALVAMMVRGLLLASSGEVKATEASFYLAVAFAMLVPPLDGIRLTLIRLRKLRELSDRVKLLSAELEKHRRLASQEKLAEQTKAADH